ncbi:MAG: hypothetical protein IJ011_08895 [Clostridia bacterium]|nr:hypothetical protein [Clostridia bacterium]
MRNKVMAIVLTVSVLLILAAAGFTGYLTYYAENRDNAIGVAVDGDGETVEFRDIVLHPGEAMEYELLLTHEAGGESVITLDFVDSAPEDIENNLISYINVEIILNGESRGVMPLTEAIEKDIPSISCELDDKEPVVLKVIYSMPLEIGNEAENAEGYIDLVITASNED